MVWAIPSLGGVWTEAAVAQDSGLAAAEWHDLHLPSAEPLAYASVDLSEPEAGGAALNEDWHRLAVPQSVEYPAEVEYPTEWTEYAEDVSEANIDYEAAAVDEAPWVGNAADELTADESHLRLEDRTLISADATSEFGVEGEPKPPVLPDNAEWVSAWVEDLKQSSEAWIQIDLSDQRLIAWEGNTPVFSVTVSTGRASNMEDITPTGVYAIENKYRTARMQGETYDIPDVPYTMYFSGSYAIHGAYWHDNFGSPVSSGCINVPVEQAAWLFNWATIGTRVVVQN
ncbi:MAG: L,D-transpeptidase [Synechococcales cyanobacterium C42_A2020_086]|nr:L,D-transpeptidase [Synechococcales cyanobacterium C42_A2020_086]